MSVDTIHPDRVLDSTFIAHVEAHAELASTNDRALELANDPHVPLPCLVIADRQGRGRGRGGNVWWSSAGALTFSLLLDSEMEGWQDREIARSTDGEMARSKTATDHPPILPSRHLAIPPSRYPEVSLTVGSSVCAALARRLPQVARWQDREIARSKTTTDHPPILPSCHLAIPPSLYPEDVRLKWPNDVYLRGRKVCGVLMEVARWQDREMARSKSSAGQIERWQDREMARSKTAADHSPSCHPPISLSSYLSTLPSRHLAIPPRLVIGIGVNVNNSVEGAPVELRQKAIALCDVWRNSEIERWRDGQIERWKDREMARSKTATDHPPILPSRHLAISRQDVLIDILQEFARQLADLLSHPERTRALWRRYDLLAGKSVTLDDGHAVISGTSLGIDDDGALLLATPAGPRRCYAGVVQSFT